MSEFHENLASNDERDPPSIRGFGITFAVVFAIVGFFPVAVRFDAPYWWALAVATFFLGAAYLAPQLLKPLNLLWFKFGMLLHGVVNPLVLGLLFLVVITPAALVMRLLGKRPIPRHFDREAESYWIAREPSGPEPDMMKNQF